MKANLGLRSTWYLFISYMNKKKTVCTHCCKLGSPEIYKRDKAFNLSVNPTRSTHQHFVISVKSFSGCIIYTYVN